MRTLILTIWIAATAMAQYRPGSLPRAYGYSASGFGSVLFPGGAPGHPVIDTSFGSRLGATVRGVAPGVGPGAGQAGRGQGRGQGRGVIVPYPVYAGASYYPYGYADQQQPAYPPPQQQQQPPVVIINQNYRPDAANPQVRDYSDAALPQPAETLKVYENKPRRALEDDKPTIYLIAMKEGSVMPALAFWVEGDTLNYITRESSHNRITLDRVDRQFSVKLNQERGLEFRIP